MIITQSYKVISSRKTATHILAAKIQIKNIYYGSEQINDQSINWIMIIIMLQTFKVISSIKKTANNILPAII